MTNEQMQLIIDDIMRHVLKLEERINTLNAQIFLLDRELNPKFVLSDKARAALDAESTIFTPGPDWVAEVRASLFPDEEDQDGAA